MQITTLLTGAGVSTVVTGQSQCEQYLLIGDVDTANPLQGLSVDVGGESVFQVQSAALLTAYMNWLMEFAGTALGFLVKLGTGLVKKNTTIRLTNAGVTTPAVFAFSETAKGANFLVGTKTINANSNETFDKFSVLILDTPANVSTLLVNYKDGHSTTMQIEESDALFALYNQSGANGRLGTCSAIDNTKQEIESVRINTNGTGAVTVLKASLPDDYFKTL